MLGGVIQLLGCPGPDAAEADGVDAGFVDSSACRGLDDCTPCACQSCQGPPTEIATACSPPPLFSARDECGCDAGACPTNDTCVRVFRQPLSGGGYGGNQNICAELCSSDADCGVGRVCRASAFGFTVCAVPSCVSDDDCTADRCGHCVPGWLNLHGGRRQYDPSQSVCVYEGPCRADSCVGCFPDPERRAHDPPHRCMR
jgi:hypothetical protein